jgi:CRP-like cAMP-binding protein
VTFSHNGLVAQLSEADQASLASRCKPSALQVGQILSTPEARHRHVYFLTDGTVASVVRDANNAGLAVGLTGNEGAVGLQCALGLGAGAFTLLVQSPGLAWCADGDDLQRLLGRRPAMLLAFSRYLWSVSQEVAALAACSQVQDIRARLAGWILMSDARNGHRKLQLTHAHVADMLGVRRASVTLAAVSLKEQGLVEYQRGTIRILDRDGLEAVSCWPVRQS